MKLLACFLLFFSLGSYAQIADQASNNEQCPYFPNKGRHEYASLITALSGAPSKGTNTNQGTKKQGESDADQ